MNITYIKEWKIFYSKWWLWIWSLGSGWIAGQTLYPVLVMKPEFKVEIPPRLLNHERIHLVQQLECIILGLILNILIWYFIDPIWFLNFYFIGMGLYGIIYYGHWLINKLNKQTPNMEAYRNICFEREAYANENNLMYRKNRKILAWLRG